MAPTPFRRKAGRTTRNVALAEAIIALARDRDAGRARRRGGSAGRNALIGGALAAAGAAALLAREKLAGRKAPDAAAPAPTQPPAYDAPPPDPHGESPVPIDVRPEGSPAGDATVPAAGLSDVEREIDEALEQAGRPLAGETFEPLASDPAAGATDTSPTLDPVDAPPVLDPADTPPVLDPTDTPLPPDLADMPGQAVDETDPDAPGGGISGRPFSGLDPAPDVPAAPTDASGPGEDDDGDEFRTWSGRSVEP